MLDQMPVLEAAWPPGLLSLDLHCYKLVPTGAPRACSRVLHDLARSIPTFSCWLKFNCQQPDRNLPQEFAEQLFALRSDICVVYKPHLMVSRPSQHTLAFYSLVPNSSWHGSCAPVDKGNSRELVVG